MRKPVTVITFNVEWWTSSGKYEPYQYVRPQFGKHLGECSQCKETVLKMVDEFRKMIVELPK